MTKKSKKKKTKKSRSNKTPKERESTGKPGGVDGPAGGAGGWSWGGAFAAASSLEQVGRPEPPDGGGGDAAGRDGTDPVGSGLAELARDHASSLRRTGTGGDRKRPRPDDAAADGRADGSDGDDGASPDGGEAGEEDGPLEGRMVDAGDGQVLVLVDRGRGVVYSSELRGDDGERLAVGTLVGGEVVLDESGPRPAESAAGKGRGKGEDDGGKPGEQAEEKAGPAEPFPYDVNPDDHCETPPEAYRDVDPLLSDLCRRLGKSKSELRIYDPYYCDGSVRRHLADIGYGDVRNERVDCYGVWEEGREPEFDVLVTNPPYSDDHIEKLMRYVTSPSLGDRPWLLLMPQWVHKKDYYEGTTTGRSDRPLRPFYAVPRRRYVYLPPRGLREKRDSDTHRKSSPFVSMWYCWGGRGMDNEAWIGSFPRAGTGEGGCDVARSRSALRDLRRGGKKGGKGKKRRRK